MRIAQLVAALDPRHGGPSRSVAATAQALASRGHEVELLTTADTEDVSTESGIVVRKFRRDPPSMLVLSADLNRHLKENAYDVIHAHGLWTRQLHYARRAAAATGARLVISPRGMLSPWALKHHGIRKRLARMFLHPGALSGADGWHATSPIERDDILAAGRSRKVCVAPNGVGIPTEAKLRAAREWWHAAEPRLASRAPVALFHSRFHKKKRVIELIDLWASLPTGDWILALVGIPEDYSVASLSEAVAAHGLSEHMIVADGTTTPHPYAIANIFLLPTHSENFGLVVAEALAAGVPALVTDAAPWAPINSNGSGWCVPWDVFGETLAAALKTPPGQLAAMGASGKRWVETEFSWARTAHLLEEFYTHLR